MATAVPEGRSLNELTQAVFGEVLTLNQVFERVEYESWGPGRASHVQAPEVAVEQLWVGSIGYERYRVNTDFAAQLRRNGVERLIDVRQLPISRRRGYAKSALDAALAAEGIEYVHMRALGNPKPTRDLYKSGRTAEGRAGYTDYLLTEQRDALAALVDQLRERRCALMCVEHDSAVCHRDVIFGALRSELGLLLDVAEIG